MIYAVSAARYWQLFRHSPTLLSTSVIACFLLLAEAMIGVAITGERKWHASWWEWHGLIVLAYLIIGFAARREWRDERFRALYLPSTRERRRRSASSSATSSASPLLRAVVAGRGRAVLNAYWRYRGAAALAGSAARSRSSSATGSSPPSTAAETSPTTQFGPRAPHLPCSARWGLSRTSTRTGRACGRREQRRGGGARSAARATWRTRWSATRSTRARAGEPRRPAGCSSARRRSLSSPTAPSSGAHRPEDEGQGRARERVRPARLP